MNKILAIFLVLIIQSCVSLPLEHKNIDCSRIDAELDIRYSLFSELSAKEIASRKEISLPNYSELGKDSVLSKIIDAVLEAPNNSKIVPVDLRYYKIVGLGNIIISNSEDSGLDLTLQTSKYAQGFFALINFSENFITIAPPPKSEFWNQQIIAQKNLNGAEILINVSDSKRIYSNMKFAPNQKISIIADRIIEPYRLDLRELSNMQHNLNNKWIMPLYSLEGSSMNGGKVTTGLFEFVNNKNTKMINLHKFYKSKGICYKDEGGDKLE
ncbi:MAG: hypothetical protein ACJAZX_000241 [Rickettsiales bacterium]|jgi:hypothetical protein